MLKLGIVGLPNVGKSTLFNALTAAGAEAANYPFCTVEPNVGMVEVPDPRLTKLAEIVQPKKTVPAVVQFVDIAGLVKGAAEGEGLGNKFLTNIRETDAIVHVIRCFEDPDVTHVMGSTLPMTCVTSGSSKQRMTWTIASVSRMFVRNLLPSPSPSAAPFTSPAMSTNCTTAGTVFFGWTTRASSCSRESGTSTMPTFGSTVQNG